MLANLFIHTLEVYRRSGKTDRFGQPVDVNPRQHTAGERIAHRYPCRATRGTGGLTMQERSIDVFETEYTIYTDAGVDVNEDDAVRVLDASGNEIVPLAKIKVKSVASDARGGHHLEFKAWAQKGPS